MLVQLFFKVFQYLKFNWPLGRSLQLVIGLLLLAEGIWGDFKIVIVPALWFLYLSISKKGCNANQC